MASFLRSHTAMVGETMCLLESLDPLEAGVHFGEDCFGPKVLKKSQNAGSVLAPARLELRFAF